MPLHKPPISGSARRRRRVPLSSTSDEEGSDSAAAAAGSGSVPLRPKAAAKEAATAAAASPQPPLPPLAASRRGPRAYIDRRDCAHTFKLVLLGDQSVGKTSLLKRFADDKFSFSYKATIGLDFSLQYVVIFGRVVKLQLWDTAGTERYRSLISSYYRGADGFLLSFSVTDRQSFDNILHWMEEIRDHAPDAVVTLVATKADDVTNRTVSPAEGQALANELGVAYVETSAQQNLNIEESVVRLSRSVFEAQQERKPQQKERWWQAKAKSSSESEDVPIEPGGDKCCIVM